MAGTRPRQNYHADSEDAVNEQINLELYAGYLYISMSYYFDRDDVALNGMRKFFKDRSEEKREHARELMKYQNKRGGRIVLNDISKPDQDEWGTLIAAMEIAHGLEKRINRSLIKLERTASNKDDAEMSDYITKEFMTEQVEDIKKLSDHITNLHRVGLGLGEFLFDKDFS